MLSHTYFFLLGRQRFGSFSGVDEPSIGHSLMNDIQQFLEKKGAIVSGGPCSITSEEEDDTLKDEDDEILEHLPHEKNNNYASCDSDSDSWCSVDEEEEDPQSQDSDHRPNKAGGGYSGSQRVRFKDPNVKKKKMDFSPPRIPKNSPSYLIWSIFTKEREEKRKKRELDLKRGGDLLEGEEAKVTYQNGFSNDYKAEASTSGSKKRAAASNNNNGGGGPGQDYGFHSTLLNGKLAELEKEISQFRKENSNLVSAKRKFATERRKFEEGKSEWEEEKKGEKKKLEEERRRIKRDRMLWEKAQKDKKSNEDAKKAAEEIEELREKVKKKVVDIDRCV